jgi:DNA adenine methylase
VYPASQLADINYICWFMIKLLVASKKAQPQNWLLRHDDLVQPFLKWAGGKRELVPKLRKFIPQKYGSYFEPFVGAGALLFDLQPHGAAINDANKELINCYRVIKRDPEGLIEHAKKHRNTKQYFYRLRMLDREAGFKNLTPLERASRIIFLNKTCYNGLFRVNSKGQFNVPFGNYSNPIIIDGEVIRAVSRYLNSASVRISNTDFEDAVRSARANDFVYLDPPYDPVSDSSSFTGYHLLSFNRDEQKRLKQVCDDLTRRRCKVLLSNSATPFIRTLYSDKSRYKILEVEVSRKINSVPKGRGKIKELLIFNYAVG